MKFGERFDLVIFAEDRQIKLPVWTTANSVQIAHSPNITLAKFSNHSGITLVVITLVPLCVFGMCSTAPKVTV